jgi:hypothetical protein
MPFLQSISNFISVLTFAKKANDDGHINYFHNLIFCQPNFFRLAIKIFYLLGCGTKSYHSLYMISSSSFTA